MKTFRVTAQAVFDIEANSDEDAIDDVLDGLDELPDYMNTSNVFILNVEEIKGEDE